jgi:hypothetical protein
MAEVTLLVWTNSLCLDASVVRLLLRGRALAAVRAFLHAPRVAQAVVLLAAVRLPSAPRGKTEVCADLDETSPHGENRNTAGSVDQTIGSTRKWELLAASACRAAASELAEAGVSARSQRNQLAHLATL